MASTIMFVNPDALEQSPWSAVIDPALLIEARDNPGKYPGLLVRVSGYSAYFDDLSPSMKQ